MEVFETVSPLGYPDEWGAYLRYRVDVAGSNLFLTTRAAPTVKIEGHIRAMGLPNRVRELAYSMMNESPMCQFETHLACDLVGGLGSVGLFRLHVFVQPGQTSRDHGFDHSALTQFK